MHRLRGEAAREPVSGVAGTRAAEPAAQERRERPADERRERPGLLPAEIEAATGGAARVSGGGTVTLTLIEPVTVKVGVSLKGVRTATVDHLAFRPLPAGFRAGGSARVLSAFAASIGRPAKVAKKIAQSLSKRDWSRVQALLAHILAVAMGEHLSPTDVAELLSALAANDI